MKSRRGAVLVAPVVVFALAMVPVVAATQCGPTPPNPTTSTTTPVTTTTLPPPVGVTLCPPAWDQLVLDDVNEARAAAGKPPVAVDAKLAAGSDNRAVTMATSRALTHDGWVQTITATGYSYSALAENIHAYVGASSVVAGWLASPAHRTNIENGIYDDVGVGCALDTQGVPWWALVIGKGS